MNSYRMRIEIILNIAPFAVCFRIPFLTFTTRLSYHIEELHNKLVAYQQNR